MQKKIRLLIIGLISLLIFFEQVLQLNSFVKQGFKLILLVLIPFAIIYFYKKSNFIDEYNIKNVSKHDLKRPFMIGVGLYILTLVGYLILKPLIDTETLVSGLNGLNITVDNIVYASLYISFINSFIEEFFFRGFVYHYFSSINKKTGYLISGMLFSIYHVLVMFTIFHWIMGVLAIIGLTIVGILLAYVNETNKSIINSWIVHIFADLGVISIGIFLFMT